MRTKNIFNNTNDLEALHSFKDFPVFMGTTNKDNSNDITKDMDWQISKSIGSIQLKNPLPLDLLYQSQTTTAAIGPTWQNHHFEFASFINNELNKKSNKFKILEIGGAHGVLEVEFSKNFNRSEWIIIEPNPSPVPACNAKFIKKFFNGDISLKNEFDCLIHSHTLEHMYDPMEFLSSLYNFMKADQKMIFSVPDLKHWLDNKFPNTLNFEHTFYLTENLCDEMLANNGFKLISKKYFGNKHSIFYHVIKDKKKLETYSDNYFTNKKSFTNFIKFYENDVKHINKKIENYDHEIYLFGAHIFSQYLLAFGLNQKKIKKIVDNDVAKQNMRLYGTNLFVESPTILSKDTKPLLILRAGAYNDEIKKQIIENINSNTYFV